MEFQLIEQEAGTALINLEISKDDYMPEFEKKLKDYSKMMKVPGFRPGKVPTGYVKKVHGKAIFAEEISKLIEVSVDGYIKENNIVIFGYPVPKKQLDVETLNYPDKIEMSFEVARIMPFEVPQLDDLAITKKVLEITDELVEKEIEMMRETYKTVENVEVSEEEDLISGKFVWEGEEEKSFPFYVAFDKILEGKKDFFIGLRVGQKVKLKLKDYFKEDEIPLLTGAKDEMLEDLLNNEQTFEVERITRRMKMERGQAFYDKILGEGVAKNEEDFKEKIKVYFEGTGLISSVSTMKKELKDLLLDKINIVLPEEAMKKLLTTKDRETDEDREMNDEEFEQYAQDYRWLLICDSYAKQFTIEIKAEELADYIHHKVSDQFRQFGYDPQMGDLYNRILENVFKDEKRVKDYHQELFYVKTVDAMLTKVQQIEKKVSSIDEISA